MQMRPDARTMNGMDTYQREAEIRLNPFGSARPPQSQRPDDEPRTLRERMSLFLTKLRALWPLGRG